MSKVGMTAATVGVGGTGAAGIYGAHHMGWFGGSGNRHGKLYVAENKADLVNRQNGGCIDHSFSGWSEDKNMGSVGQDSDSFSLPASPAETGGCLVYNWERNLDTKGVKSSFRLVWTLSRGNAGFVVYLNLTDEGNSQMKFEGVAYAMEQTAKGWSATKYLAPDKDSISTSDLKNLFPKVDKGKVFENGGLEDEYWGFLDSNGTKVKEGKDYRSGRRKWTGGTGEELLKAWSPNLSDWWKGLFDGELKYWDMAKVIGEIKGKWEKY